MIVKAIYKDKEHNYFRDKTTADNIENQVKRHFGDLFECDDNLAEERIKKGLVKKATKKEEKEYCDNIVTIDENDLNPSNKENEESSAGDNRETDSNKSELSKTDDESTKVKSLEECTDNELWKIVRNENIDVNDSVSRVELIEIINKVRAERLDQPNN